MHSARKLISIAALLLVAVLSLRAWLAPGPAHIDAPASPAVTETPVLSDNKPPDSLGGERVRGAATAAIAQIPAAASGQNKILQIFGRVTDRDGRPIENVFVNEARYFFNTRSDADGHYVLLLDLPRHRFPQLQFLRAGYAAENIDIEHRQLQQQSLYRLDVSLDDMPGAIRLPGWIGDEIGLGLEGARIELTTLESDGDYSLTVFSDARGGFVFEGVPAQATYRLSANLAPKYPMYENMNLFVSADPEQINIVLRSLEFVDIDGMIVTRDATPLPNFELYIANLTTGLHTRRIVSDSSGFFSLQNFPLGEVALTTRGNEFHKISGLELTPDGYRNLKLTIDRGDYHLGGWIYGSDGLPIERAMVTIERGFRQGSLEMLHYRSQASDANGRFAFANLGSGEYRVAVYAQGYRKHEFSHRFGNPYDEIRVTLQRDRP